MRHIFFLIFFHLFLGCKSLAQGVELDMQVGYHNPGVKYHHPTPVIERSGENTLGNTSYLLGIASQIYNGVYLRTELGYMRTNFFMDISYDVTVVGTNTATRFSWFSNQRIYLGVIPEYRVAYKAFSIKGFAGPLLVSDVSNRLLSVNQVGFSDRNLIGLKAGIGGIIMIKKVGLTATVSHVGVPKYRVFSSYDPYLSYKQTHVSAGVLYRF